eukprot:m.26920 g.26920  ORF g.26920 m.26920 type:complete len:108 (+) comp29588_c0_seq1:212-535(+)
MGYFSRPLLDACPHWNKSIVVIGYALSYIVYSAASSIQKGKFQFWVVLQVILLGVGYLICCLSTAACNTSTPKTTLLAEFFPGCICSTVNSNNIITFLVCVFHFLRI